MRLARKGLAFKDQQQELASTLVVLRDMCTTLTRLMQRGYDPGAESKCNRWCGRTVASPSLAKLLGALLLAALFHIVGWTCEALLHQSEASIPFTALAARLREDSCG